MSEATARNTTLTAAGFVASLAAFAVMLGLGIHQTVLLIPLGIAWVLALMGLKNTVEENRRAALYFAFAIMAVMIFFLHETYEMKGKVRTFPLIIGYTGMVFSVLDILSVTDTRIGRFVTRALGAALEESEIKHPRISKELLVFASMGLGVLGIWLFGFLIASPIFVFLWMLIGGRKSLKLALYVGLGTFVFIYGLFELILKYELFLGVVTTWIIELYEV